MRKRFRHPPAQRQQIGRFTRDMGSRWAVMHCLSLKTVRFIGYLLENACRTRKPPARKVCFRRLSSTPEHEKNFRARRLSYTHYIPGTSPHTIHPVSRTVVCFRHRRRYYVHNTHRVWKRTSVGVFSWSSPFLHHMEHENTSTGMRFCVGAFPAPRRPRKVKTHPFGRFSCLAPSSLNVARGVYPLRHFFSAFIEYTFIVLLFISNVINLNVYLLHHFSFPSDEA